MVYTTKTTATDPGNGNWVRRTDMPSALGLVALSSSTVWLFSTVNEYVLLQFSSLYE